MALFFKKQAIRENRIENAGRWPIRLTDFYLVDDYEFPPSRFTEVFFVRSGNFLHETDNGTQAVRAGSAIVHHPASRHVVKKPDQVRLSRIRFLPEWLAPDFTTILGSPDVLWLLFARTWFSVPQEESLQVFTTRESQFGFLSALFDLLHQRLRTGRHGEAATRVTLLELLLLFGDEYHVYWRGGNRIELPDEVLHSLPLIEQSIAAGGRLPLKQLQSATRLSQEALSQSFRKHIGLTLVDYAQSRRVQIAASRLLGTATPVEDIATDLGFGDTAQLERAIEKTWELSPDAYRQKFGAVTATEPPLIPSVPVPADLPVSAP